MESFRNKILPETDLPDPDTLVQIGREAAVECPVGPSPFLAHHNVTSEWEYKVRNISDKRIMRHAQIGYRSLKKTCQGYRDVFEQLRNSGCTVDRYGICLDWSMGYPQIERANRPKGTGLILDSADAFAELTAQAPVAPHFGDFVMGMPAAFENTRAALRAGSTSIGNLGQYFTFRLPHWNDDVSTTAETIKAIALCAAQPVPVLIHSNLDDGFAALFSDLSCALGAVLLERYIIDDLLGGHCSHCYGHTYSEPLARLAFQHALADVSETPGTMIYGNTTIYSAQSVANYAGLGSYLMIDVLAQILKPSGHAINPVPVSEAQRIPDIGEIVDAHLFANRLIKQANGFEPLINLEKVNSVSGRITEGAQQFMNNVIEGFEQHGIDTSNPLEMLLSVRRLGARFLELHYGPGEIDTDNPRQRKAIYLAATISELKQQADDCVANLGDENRQRLQDTTLRVCVATTDVHEYGKLLVESVLSNLGIPIIDGGVCTDPEELVNRASAGDANVIAISTYNGIALDYLKRLTQTLVRNNMDGLPIYIGGKLNQIVEHDSVESDDLPVDVSGMLRDAGAIPCESLSEMLLDLPCHHQ